MDDMSEYMNQKEETELGTAERLNLDIALAIEYAKSFDVFRRMPLRDKFFLLRDVTLVLSLFESAYQSFLRRRSISAIEAIVKLEPKLVNSHIQSTICTVTCKTRMYIIATPLTLVCLLIYNLPWECIYMGKLIV
uniref:Nuclear receptor domain-containing protein n=1 Tax=Parascaris univalens TaxID=6257 RepID=A0A914ZNM3_PARUN